MAEKGYGSTLHYGDKADYADTPVVFTKFSTVTDITPPSETVEEIDISHLESAGQYREYCASWKDNGDCSFTVQYAKADYTAIRALVSETKAYKLEFSDGSDLQFNGFVKEVTPELDADGIITANVAIKVTGPMQFTESV